MKLVIEIDPRNDYEIIDAIETLRSLPAYGLEPREEDETRQDLAKQDKAAGKVIDLMEALKASLADAAEQQKPSEVAAPAPVGASTVAASEQDAITAMQDLVKRNGGIAKAVEVLKSFGVARVTELTAKQRGAFIEKAKAA